MKNAFPNTIVIPRKEGMNVDVHILSMPAVKHDEALVEHLKNAAKLPSAMHVLGLPNLSTAHIFVSGCIVSTARTIIPGIVSDDINAGIRLIATSAKTAEVRIRQIEQAIQKAVPSGERSENIRLNEGDLRLLLEMGCAALGDVSARVPSLSTIRIEAEEEADNRKVENNGSILTVSNAISHHGIERALNQLGTLGDTEHYVDMLSVEGIFNNKAADELGIFKDQLIIVFTAGSRGIGRHVAEEYIRLARELTGDNAPERGLCHFDIESPEAESYLQAYACAGNFAYVNRQVIAALMRHELRKVIGPKAMPLALDIPYNTLRNEAHGQKQLWVHRRGAAKVVSQENDTGGKHGYFCFISGFPFGASYILASGKKMPLTLNSLCVNAGIPLQPGVDFGKVDHSHIVSKVDEIVRLLVDMGLAEIVARLKPISSAHS